MGRVILCSGKKARQSYFMESVNINIWTIEELVYILVQNLLIWDKELMNKELVEWIKIECDLPQLSKKLTTYLHHKTTVDNFILEIIRYIGYYSAEEIEGFKLQVKEGESIPKLVKYKQRIDGLVEENKCGTAILEYDKVLVQLSNEDVQLKAEILHNQGVAYCRMLQFFHGAKCFFEAYQLGKKEDSFEQYLFATRMYMEDEAYINYIASQDIRAEESVAIEKILKKIDALYEESNEKARVNKIIEIHQVKDYASYEQQVEESINVLKNNYRKAFVEIQY